MEKQTIRNEMRSKREINRVRHAELSRAISEKLLQSDIFLSFPSYFIYVGTDDEVGTKELIRALLQKGKRVFAPRTEPEGVVAVEIDGNTEYRKGAFGIEEPIGEAYRGVISLAVVPMVAFDDELNRLGHGKGYYDAFLHHFEGYKLGIAFDYQRVPEIDVEIYDVPMDGVVTEKDFYPNPLRG